MIGLVHGYGLSGAGSNLWTRETVAALCDNGETVHLACQEPHPERFDFVAELWRHGEGEPERKLSRDVPYPGRCILHKPDLNVLPTYVRPDRESDYVRSILDLEMDALEEYLRRNVAALRRISRDTGVRAWHVNHTILLSEALRRLQGEDGLAYGVMPHGSALEYVVRHDERMQPIARRAVDAADAVFALNQEIRDRLAEYFPGLDLAGKTVTVRVGVDTDGFRPVPRHERSTSVERLARALEGVDRGHRPSHAEALRRAVDRTAETLDRDESDRDGAARDGAAGDEPDPGHALFRDALEPALDYPTGHPDADLEERLRAVDWQGARILTFVGRLIPAKGVGALVVALPRILERHPETRLVLAGTGWLREYLEAFVLALSRGDGELAWRLARWMGERRQEGARPSTGLFLRQLREGGGYDDYVASAAQRLTPDHVLFTGFLEHPLLAHVFPLADVAVFPSAVPEASPLVIPEAAACGCLPMGTDFAGMHHSLASLAPRLPDELARLMRLDPDPAHTVDAIVANVVAALDLDADVTEPLRNAAVEEYDWHGIADDLARALAGLEEQGRSA